MDSYPQLSLYIDGKFLPADGRFTEPVDDPATGSVLGWIPHATREDLDNALSAASRAFGEWRKVSALERSNILRRAAAQLIANEDAIARNITRDQGKPLFESLAEVRASAEHLEWHAEECRRQYGRVIPARNPDAHQYAVKEPLGVCAAFTPWNFPLSQAVRKVAAAIGAGCTLVLKGPENTPSAILALARAFHDAGLPPGCLNAVWGVPHEVSAHLIESPVVKAVSFTGSVAVGKQIAALAAGNLQRVTLELGGHAPAIVFDDADLETAVGSLVKARFRNAGQVCIAPSRFYVQAGIYDRFVARFTELASRISVGNGMEPQTEMGPLAHAGRVNAFHDLYSDAVAQHAEVALADDATSRGRNFVKPAVLLNVPETARLMNEEPFCPITPINRWTDEDAVLESANRLPYGLAAFVFTASSRRSSRMAKLIEAGQISINHLGLALAEVPVTGVKDSGIGTEGGAETFDGYLSTKFVTQLH